MPLAQVPGGFVPGVLTSAALNAGLLVGRPLFVRKTADQSVTSSTTLIDDTELYGTVAPNCTYRFELHMFYVGNETGDINTRWTFPTGATLDQMTICGWPIDTGFNTGGTHADTEFYALLAQTSPSTARPFAGSTTVVTALIVGTLVVGGTAGTLQLQWAQNVSNGTATTVKAGSCLELRRVA